MSAWGVYSGYEVHLPTHVGLNFKFEVQGLLASGHEVGMVGSCPYLDATLLTTIHSARYMNSMLRSVAGGTGPTVIVQAVGHKKVQADVEAAVLNMQGGIHTCDSAQDDDLILYGHTINC